MTSNDDGRGYAVQEALNHYNHEDFRKAVCPFGAYQEAVDRYGYRGSYARYVWENAYSYAREYLRAVDEQHWINRHEANI